MFKFLMDFLHGPRREVAKRNKVTVISQVLQFRYGDVANKEIVRGWLHVANLFGVNPEKLRAVDTKSFISSLDGTNGDMNSQLDRLLSQNSASPLSDDTTLIELSQIVGQLKGESAQGI